MRNKITILLFCINFVMIMNCAAGIAAKRLIYRDHKSAFYTLEEEELSKKEREILGAPFLHPIRRTNPENWKAVLGNLQFKKESSVGNMIYHIFAEAELDDLTRNIVPSLDRLSNDKILVVISKYNDLKGVVSNDHRTTFAIFKNKEGIHIVFREIHGGMPGVDAGNYYEWSSIPDFLFLKNYEVFQVEEKDFFRYKAVNGYENRLWITIDDETFKTIEFNPRKTEEPELETKDSMEKTRKSKSSNSSSDKTGKLPKSEVYIQRDLD